METTTVQETLKEQDKTVEKKVRSQYKKYNQSQIEHFVQLLQEEGLSVVKAAEKSGIPRSTAYELRKQFNKSGGSILPSKRIHRKSTGSIKEEHAQFLVDYIDQNPFVSLKEVQQELVKAVGEPAISLSTLRIHMDDQCALSFKRADHLSGEWTTRKPKSLRDWMREGLRLTENCVFLDQVNFNLQTTRSRSWSHKESTKAIKRGIDIAIIGCISPNGTINFSKVNPVPHETISPIAEFLTEVMDVLDRHAMKHYHIVMDSARIHSHDLVEAAVNARGYRAVFLTPNSYNPMEACWSKIKFNIKRTPLDAADKLTPRIKLACESVTPEDCLQWIQQSQSMWEMHLHEQEK
ncbi:hypothetical protein G6F46_005718 [Rhizopus delemar]|uniref:Tc1-like transposase DDE domain-containing protein n=2 Tax=Rhizopus delemar TaxID=936053 RepID=I1C233_RHIO9|nr:hypothetical protein RO3G_07218 [Rhizopus delemar RA 99-880]KAG1450520.1 hypothetical protein G6F55_009648 [Rhizopus delemar]KAG1612024.1 hypothetical protein G6F45_013018 [Rhizopus arrhizus]KAG1497431.1 hypothetical protein G6F54_005763 [Rhizopus delemar]KAG1498622.1 hypothetical protein G6F52_012742 [Rhizopus delemar]|eukprot:EIE82513.1 hypothetical protein RO3G_07218 [Rhizopus delemar RA 99-880]